MRLSTSIIIVSAVVGTVATYPTDFIKRGVSSALSFPCGDDVPNVNLHFSFVLSNCTNICLLPSGLQTLK